MEDDKFAMGDAPVTGGAGFAASAAVAAARSASASAPSTGSNPVAGCGCDVAAGGSCGVEHWSPSPSSSMASLLGESSLPPPTRPSSSSSSSSGLFVTQVHNPLVYNDDYSARPLTFSGWTEYETLEVLEEDLARNRTEGDVATLCVSCEKPGLLQCLRCQTARYCSEACQMADATIHGHICGQLAGEYSDRMRPAKDRFRVVLFPYSLDKPRFQWAKRRGDDEEDWWLVDPTELGKYSMRKGLPDVMKYKTQSLLDPKILPERRFGRALTLVTYDADNYNGPCHDPDPVVVNRSLVTLLGAGCVRFVFGPAVFFSEATLPGPFPMQTRDVTPRDLHTLVRFLERRDGICPAIMERFPYETIPAIRINDLSSPLNKTLGIQYTFEAVNAPLRPLNDCSDYPNVLAFLLGLRWYIRPADPTAAGRGGGNGMQDTGNRETWQDKGLDILRTVAFNLQESTDAGVNETLMPALLRRITCQYKVAPLRNSFMLLHGSGKGVDAMHVMAFSAYLRQCRTNDGRLAGFNKEGFARFWQWFKVAQGIPWAPSPWQWETSEHEDRIGTFNASLLRLKFIDDAKKGRIGVRV